MAWTHLRQHSDGWELLFVTTHFDNNSPSQELSAPLFLERTEPWAAEMPVVATGDFNSQPDDLAYRILTEGVSGTGFHLTNAFDLADDWRIDTNQEPVPDYDVPGRIDHIFVAGGDWSCPDWAVDLWVYGDLDRYPSDHFAMSAELIPGL